MEYTLVYQKLLQRKGEGQIELNSLRNIPSNPRIHFEETDIHTFKNQDKSFSSKLFSCKINLVNKMTGNVIAVDNIQSKTAANHFIELISDTEGYLYKSIEEFLGFPYGRYTDRNRLLNVSRKFQHLKKEKFHWNLNEKYSARYYRNITYKRKLDSLLSNTKTQLSLALELGDCDEISDASVLINLYLLQITECDISNSVLNALGALPRLIIQSCESITDVSGLGNVENLSIFDCDGITDVSALRNVHILHIGGGHGIRDFSVLSNVHSLQLSCCYTLFDLSGLDNVHTLEISRCPNLEDLSGLGNVHTLILNDCQNLSDVSAGGGVHTFKMIECNEILDVSALLNVHYVSLISCDGINNVNALVNVHTLSVYNCNGISGGISDLIDSVQNLSINMCNGLSDENSSQDYLDVLAEDIKKDCCAARSGRGARVDGTVTALPRRNLGQYGGSSRAVRDARAAGISMISAWTSKALAIHLRDRVPSGSKVLDICSGGGDIGKVFSELGHDVTS